MLREQVITPRAGRNWQTKGRGGESAQHPQRRAKERRERKGNGGMFARAMWRWLVARWRLIGKLTLAMIVGVVFFAAYRAAASASFFQVKQIDVEGVTRANVNDIRATVQRMVAPSGVWRADLEAVCATIKRQQTWVRDVSISRVLPSGIRVRVTERIPEAVIHSASGRLMWVDADGVTLGAASNFGTNASANRTANALPPMPAFLIRGWDENDSVEARAENKDRIAAYREMLSAWTKVGIVERVSEVNLQDLRDVRAQLAGDDAQIEVRLGREKFGGRLERALKVLSDMKNDGNYTRGSITHLNAIQTGRVVVGFSSGWQAANDESARDESETAPADALKAKTSGMTNADTSNERNIARAKVVTVTNGFVKSAHASSRVASATKAKTSSPSNHEKLTNASPSTNRKLTNGEERPRRITQR